MPTKIYIYYNVINIAKVNVYHYELLNYPLYLFRKVRVI